MPNVFDEFLEELRRRQAKREAGDQANAGRSDDEVSQSARDEGPTEEKTVRSNGSGSDDSGQDDRNRPPIFPRGFSRGGGRGFSDEMPEIHISRGWIILGGLFTALIVLITAFLIL